MNDLKLIFSKFSFLENPAKVLKLLWQLENLMKKQKTDYPKVVTNNDLYVRLVIKFISLSRKKFVKKLNLPKQANLIMISKVAFVNSLKVMNRAIYDELNQLLRAVRKEKNLKKSQEIIDEISKSFLTNLSMKELIRIIRKQVV